MRSLILVAVVLVGCNRAAITAPPTKAPNENLTGQQRVVAATPILRRTMTQNDLDQLKIFIVAAQADSGKYPKTLAEMPGIERDAPKLVQYIKDGDLVLAGGKNGILAYEKNAIEVRGSVVTTTGIQVMTKDELEKALGGS